LRGVTIARMDAGLSIGELAERAGVQRETLSRIENGHTVPRAATLYKLGQALRLKPSEIIALGERDAARRTDVEGAAAELVRLEDTRLMADYAHAYAGEGFDALSRITALEDAVRRRYEAVKDGEDEEGTSLAMGYFMARSILFAIAGRALQAGMEVEEKVLEHA
jgi:transcriptional regulator with XRE-family HTH domain